MLIGLVGQGEIFAVAGVATPGFGARRLIDPRSSRVTAAANGSARDRHRPSDRFPADRRSRLPPLRRKGAARPCGMGLRPTLPPTDCSGVEPVVGSGQMCGQPPHEASPSSACRIVPAFRSHSGALRVAVSLQSCCSGLAAMSSRFASSNRRSADDPAGRRCRPRALRATAACGRPVMTVSHSCVERRSPGQPLRRCDGRQLRRWPARPAAWPSPRRCEQWSCGCTEPAR